MANKDHPGMGAPARWGIMLVIRVTNVERGSLVMVESKKDGGTDDPWLELLERARSGDANALERLLREVRPYLKKVIRVTGVSTADVSDVVQEALMRIWRHVENKNVRAASNAQLVSWLTKVAQYGALIALRDGQRQKRDVRKQVELPESRGGSVTLVDPRSTPSLQAARRELVEKRAEARKLLSDNMQEVLRLKDDEDLSWEEIASQMERTTGAVQRLYYRAVESWREKTEK